MANAACLNENGDFKLCPFRVHTEVHPALVMGSGDITTQTFYPCAGLECIAYHVGVCLRLQEALQKVDYGHGRKGGV